MHPLPHIYPVTATANPESSVTLTAPGVAAIKSAGPIEFGGPGDLWSPESLLSASVADCFVLSFRAIARASRFEWLDLDCHVDGVLDRVEGKTRFTDFTVTARLTIRRDDDRRKAEKLVQKAEAVCLISS